MELKEMISRRMSARSFTGEPVSESILQNIRTFSSGLRPLYPDIKIRSEIVDKDQVKCFLPWTTPQLIAVFSEEKDGALENVGFMFQQLDLYLQSIGLGVCWLGMGRLSEQDAVAPLQDDGLKFIILLAFGHPKGSALRSDIKQFRRKTLAEISDRSDELLEPARLAPSSVNSQPWYFTHADSAIHAYRTQRGILKKDAMSYMNRIDMGIALAHLYVANPDTFRFFRDENAPGLKGCEYTGSFTI